MEAPENIWLSPNEYRSNEPSCFWSESQRTDYDIEYTRTDAFIDKACEWLESLYAPDGSIAPCHAHIIEDFKNYMKGE